MSTHCRYTLYHDAEAIEGQDGKPFIPLGCFKDSKMPTERAVPELINNMRGHIDWQHLDKVVKDCAHKVVMKNSTLKVITNI